MKPSYFFGFIILFELSRHSYFEQLSDIDERLQHHTVWSALKTAFNISNLTACDDIHRCKRQEGYCKCDDLCNYYNDCCHDKPSKFAEVHLPSSVSCITTLSKRPVPVAGKSFYMVSKCPSNWKDGVVKILCHNHQNIENVFEKAPISSNRTFLAYRNKYCAICNDVTRWEARAWYLGVDCKNLTKPQNVSLSFLFESYMNDKHCYYEYIPPVLIRKPRGCISESSAHVTNCPSTAGTKFCEPYMAPIFIAINKTHYKSYQNIHCLRCDNSQIKGRYVSDIEISCIGDYAKGNQDNAMFNMFDFGELIWSSSSQSGVRVPCKNDEILIQLSDQCVQLYCPLKSIPYLGKCIPYKSKVHTALLDLLYFVNGSVDIQTVYRYIVSDLSKMSKFTQVSFKIMFDDMAMQVINGTNILSNGRCIFVKATCDLTFLGIAAEHKMQLIRNYITSSPKHLIDDIFIAYTNDVLSTPCSTNQEVEDPVLISLIDEVISSHVIHCPSIQVSIQRNVNGDGDEFLDAVQGKGNVSVNAYVIGDVIINSSHVNVTKHGVFICLSTFKRYYAKNITSSTITGFLSMVITYSSMSVSIFCLIITVIHYSIISGLLTRYSVITLHLVTVTLLTQVLYMFKEMVLHNVSACWWLGLHLHFLFLLMFATTSLSLLQICFQLRSMRNPLSSEGLRKLIVRFILPGYLYAFVIILATVLLNLYTQPTESWYGGETCFIRYLQALVYGFAVPVAFCIIFNICVFSSVTKFLCSAQYSTDKTLKTNKNYFLISLKLSTIMGIGWILGFIAVFARMQWIIYAFEVTASLQGLFLSASLLSNHTVVEWYRQKYLGCLQRADKKSKNATHRSNVNQGMSKKKSRQSDNVAF